jgi:phosphate transport system substrate-binding protein
MNKRVGAFVLAAALAGTGFAGGALAQQARVEIDGSSTVFPITEALAEEFQIAEKGKTQVTVGVSGTGGGFKKFCRGETDISGASRPIKPSERELCKQNGVQFIELPVAMDALAVVVHPDNDWAQYLTVDELRKMWEPAAQGKITNWNQIRSSFPNRPLALFGAGTDSGTYDYFVEAITDGKGTRGDFTASEDDNILVQGVTGNRNALGFFGLAYLEENQGRLKAVAIKNGDSKPVKPSVETAKSGQYQPLARPLFFYVAKKSAETDPAVRRFVEFAFTPETAAELVREVGYVPLPDKAYQLAMQSFKKRETGTAFAEGAKVGVSIEDLLSLQKSN